ncbi:MAG: hypothetical protein M3282_11635 [Gemmatimonadota bacterium]|nr:hypothetical protein [Gemmatimonadota bacterium]
MSRVRALPAFGRILAIAAVFVLGACGEQRPTEPAEPARTGFLFGLPSSSATLVECPTSESRTTTATIGVLGGTLSLGGTSVFLPVGAVLAPTTIELTIPASQYMEIGIKANGAEHFLFKKSILVTIDYSRCDRSDVLLKPLTVWEIDPQTKALIEKMGGIDNKLTQSITFSTIHLSGYAIAF